MKNRQDADIMLHATKAEIFQMFETLLSEVDNGVLFDESDEILSIQIPRSVQKWNQMSVRRWPGNIQALGVLSGFNSRPCSDLARSALQIRAVLAREVASITHPER